MEKVNYYIDQVDRELKKVQLLNTLDEKAKIPKLKTYITLGLAAVISVFIFFNIFGDLLSTLVSIWIFNMNIWNFIWKRLSLY